MLYVNSDITGYSDREATARLADLRGFLAAFQQAGLSEPKLAADMARCCAKLGMEDADKLDVLIGGVLETATRLRPRFLLITSGTAGSGKSTVADMLARRWGLLHLQTDVVRKRLVGLEPTARTDSPIYGGIYAPAMSDATYRELGRQAEEALRDGSSVVVDGTFLTRSRRAALLEAGRRNGCHTAILHCILDQRKQIQRLQERMASPYSVSEGGQEVMARNELDWEPILPEEADAVVMIDTGSELQEVEAEVFMRLWPAVLRLR